MTDDGLITVRGIIDFYTGSSGIIKKAQSIVNNFDNKHDYMQTMGSHIMTFLLDTEHEFLPGTDTDVRPKSIE